MEASDGTNTDTLDVTVTVTGVNERPDFAPAFYNKMTLREHPYDEDATDDARAVIDAVGVDVDADTVRFSIGGADRDDFEKAFDLDNYVLVAFVNVPDYEQPTDSDEDNIYEFTIVASDGDKTRERAYTVTVTNRNERPVINKVPVPDYMEIEHDYTGALTTLPVVHRFTATDYDANDEVGWFFDESEFDNADFLLGEIDEAGILIFRQVSTSDHLPDYERPRDGDSDNTYNVRVFAHDSSNLATPYAVTVTVIDVNEKPEFTGTPVIAISQNENEVASDILEDYDARDEEGLVTWSLTGDDRGDFSIDSDGVLTFNNVPNYEDAKDSDTDNIYEVSVVATDVESGSTRRNVAQDVTVTVNDLEEFGAVSVNNVNPGVGDELSFELSDPDGIVISATSTITWDLEQRDSPSADWEDVSGFSNIPTTSTRAIWRVQEAETDKQLRMRVSYTDNRGMKTVESEVTAAVTADPIVNAPPRITGGGNFFIPEGEAGRDVGTPIMTSDRDNDSLTFGIEAGLGDDVFTIHATSGQLSLIKAVDFEDPPVTGFYLVTVTLHDGKDAAGEADPMIDTTAGISVTVTDVEEDGVVTLSSEEPESGTPLDATLEDGDGSVSGESWQWARSANGRSNWVNITAATSASYTPTEDDEDFYLRARVEYTDNRGSGKSAEGITTGPVPSENRRPTFPDTETGDRTVDENTRARVNIGAAVAASDPERNRLTYSLTGDDTDAFTIVAGSGQLRTKDPLDYEAKDSYSVTVNVHDGRDGAGASSTDIDDTQDVTITVENVEEPGTVTLTTAVENISARVEVIAALTDPDESISGLTWQWSHSPNGRTNWANIAGADQDAYTPLDGHEGRYIRATASYTDGHGANKTTHGVSPRRVEEPPPVNSAPAFSSTENGRREVAEDASGGDDIGDPIVATDLNAGDAAVNDPLSYSMSGTDAASFTIDAGTGQLSLAANVELDYETKRSYRVTVQVTDGYDRLGDDEDPDVIDARINVTINVTDVNEAPAVTGDTTVSFAENGSGPIATYTGKDPERDDLTWSTSGADGDDFAMTAPRPAALRLAAQLRGRQGHLRCDRSRHG